MRWSMLVADDKMQINLTPENDHEREAVKILKSHSGEVSLHHGVDISACSGGYLREWESRPETLAITITKPKPATLPALDPQ